MIVSKGKNAMASDLLRNMLKERVRSLLGLARASKGLSHSGMRGGVAEQAFRALVGEVLPSWAKTGSGKVIDIYGGQSNEIDLAVFSSFVMPAIFVHREPGDQLIPIETCINTVEIKTTLNATELKKAIANARSVAALRHKDDAAAQATPVTSRTSSALFALGSDLPGDKRKTELARYLEHDSNAFVRPALSAICVAGRGVWLFRQGTPNFWQFTPANTDNDEVIDFLSLLSNGILAWMGRAAEVRFGQYAIDPRAHRRHFEDGQCHEMDPRARVIGDCGGGKNGGSNPAKKRS